MLQDRVNESDVSFNFTIRKRISFITYKNSINNGNSNGDNDYDSNNNNDNDNKSDNKDNNEGDNMMKTHIHNEWSMLVDSDHMMATGSKSGVISFI